MSDEKENPIRVARVALFVAIGVIAIGLSHVVDLWVAARVYTSEATTGEWAQMLRSAGWAPTWIVVAIALVLIDRKRARPLPPPLRDSWTRGVLLAASALAAGLLAEGVKLVVRRGRPMMMDGEWVYAFRAYSDGPLSTGGLGMVSSHGAVAFGAALILCRLHPAASVVWLGIAAGCGATRVLSRAHFVSDVVASAFLGCAVGWLLWRWHLANLARSRAGAP